MKVIFSHGKESGPWGFKIKRLAAIADKLGYDIDSVVYRNQIDPDQRVAMLLSALKNESGDIILVGSSMGGYVSLVASETIESRAVFLMAPALYMPGYKNRLYDSITPHMEFVHGWGDDVIAVENSVKFARQADCTLHLISGNHDLNDSIEVVESLFREFLINIR